MKESIFAYTKKLREGVIMSHAYKEWDEFHTTKSFTCHSLVSLGNYIP